MGHSSLFRHLRVLTEAGIRIESKCRPNIVGFLADGEFEDDGARREWLRQAVFAVRARGVANPGGYIKSLADRHARPILNAAERRLYAEAVERGFGRDGWDLRSFVEIRHPGGRRA